MSLFTVLLCLTTLALQTYASRRQNFWENPMFPGNSGWNAQFQQSMQASRPRPNYGGNYGGNHGWSSQPQWQRPDDDPLKVGSAAWLKIHANPLIPKFPKNFPFPPHCRPTADPGFKYPDNPSMNFHSDIPVRPEYSHSAQICADHRYAEPFYMLKTTLKMTVDRVNGKTDYNSGTDNADSFDFSDIVISGGDGKKGVEVDGGDGEKGSGTKGINNSNSGNIVNSFNNFGNSGSSVTINGNTISGNGFTNFGTSSNIKYYTIRGEEFKYKAQVFHVYLRGPPPGKTDDSHLSHLFK